MQKILSISIAAYNQEKYLARCLNSLLIPSVDKLEIIVVNDGSKDKTSEIAHCFQSLYPNSIIVIDKSNGHYGSCANASLKIAKGKYYKLLDADDFFDSEALEQFVKSLEEDESDMVLTGHIICRTPNVPILPQNVALGTSYNLSDVDFKKTNNGGCLGMHGVTYKLDILKQCGLILTEGCCATDAEYCYYPIGYCKTVSFYNYPLYMYQTDIEGQDTTIINAKQKEDKYKVAYRMLNDFIINHSSNSTIMANQELVLERSMISYYGIFIMHFADNAIDKGRIKGMDNLIKKFASSLYHDMNKVHQYKIPFIKFYRSTGLTLYKLVPILGKLKG